MSDRTSTEMMEFQLLRVLDEAPRTGQRGSARRVQISLGAVNYCLRALQQKGLVKISHSRAADNKPRYCYVLTPNGAAARMRIAQKFLARKLEEYDRLEAEIDAVRAELAAAEARAATARREDP